jgi:hypothetical protein
MVNFHGTQRMCAASRSCNALALEASFPVTYFIVKPNCIMYGVLIIATCVMDRTCDEKVKYIGEWGGSYWMNLH